MDSERFSIGFEIELSMFSRGEKLPIFFLHESNYILY
nr:MAG TPA: hypothetical protein [Caudoviricetes sp.]